MAEYYGLKDRKGVLVADVFKGDPADAAGIRPQDIILDVDGKKVETSRELTSLIADIRVGRSIEVNVLRAGKKKTFDVKIARRQEKRNVAQQDKKEYGDELGIRVSNLTEEIVERFNIQETLGVLVIEVEAGSKGNKAGIREGDIIREINHKEVNTVSDYKKILSDTKDGDAINLFIKRMNAGFLVIKMTK